MEAELTLLKRGGLPEDAPEAPRLVHASDPAYYDFLFGSTTAAQAMLGLLWRTTGGTLSHVGMTVWQHSGKLVALASHYPSSQAAALDAADDAQIAILEGLQKEYLCRSAELAWLFPHIPSQAWYLRTLVVAAHARSKRVGSLALMDIAGSAQRMGATELHTDVDSGNPGAVRFYLRHGFEIVTETRVPRLESFDLPASYRMVKKLA